MNILFLNSARRWGGNENWVRLAAHSLEDGKNHSFLAYRDETIGRQFEISKYLLPFRHEADIPTIVGLIKIVKQHSIDVLIPTKQKDYFLAGLVSRYCGCKNILRLGIVRALGESFLKKLIYHRFCNGIIVNAQTIKEVLLESSFMVAERIAVIHNGIDCDHIVKQACQKQVDKAFNFVIATSGMLIHRKRVDLLFRAFRQFLQKFPDAPAGISVIGEGKEEDSLKRLAAELEIDKRVMFYGFQDNPFPILVNADVFTLSSENEGISNSMLEAMALKIPVVVADSGGTNEVISESNGFIVNWTDTKTVSQTIEKLYQNNDLRVKIGINGFKTIQTQFTPQEMKEQILYFTQKLE